MLVLLDCSASCDPKLHALYATWRWQELRLMDDSERAGDDPLIKSIASLVSNGRRGASRKSWSSPGIHRACQ
jgi:hypothetical protein